jgi:catechol 2,3-dioxygenase-like lactoylglutathione lyase family enzyme
MAQLRHIAVVVGDLEKSATFYERVFGLKRVGRDDLEFASGIYLSDGIINLALLNYKDGAKGSGLPKGSNFRGAHHFGFVVDDLEEAGKKIEENGGSFFFDLGSEEKENFERKFKDPDGTIFDVSKKGWVGTQRS